MNKKLIIAVTLLTLGFSSTAKAMAIPSHSIIIGTKAYSLDYIVKPSNFGEINNAINSAGNSNIYYVANSTTIKNLFTDEYVSPSVIDSISAINYKDKDGEQYIARGGQNYMEHVASPFTAVAKVEIGTSFNLIKKITVTSTTVPDANYFSIGGSNVTYVGNPAQITSIDSSATVYFYADSSGQNLVATGTLDIGTSTGSVTTSVSDVQFAMGNSSGNINNMGFVAGDSKNQWVYYRGTGGNLAKIKTDGVDRTQLTTAHDAKYINVVGNYVYYVHSNAATKTVPATTCVYRMKVDGSDAQPIMSGTKQVGTMGNLVFTSYNDMKDVIVAGDYIYYIKATDGSLHRVNVNGYGTDNQISSDNYQDINIVKNYIYAVNNSQGGKIYKIDLATNNFPASKVSDVEVRHLNVVDGWMYYRNYDDNEKLYRMNIDGTHNVKLCDDMVYNINVTENSVYYKNGSDGNKLYSINVDGTGGQRVLSPVPLVKGNKVSNDVVENINVIDPTIYFSPANLSTVTSIQSDGTSKTVLK